MSLLYVWKYVQAMTAENFLYYCSFFFVDKFQVIVNASTMSNKGSNEIKYIENYNGSVLIEHVTSQRED